MVRNFSDDAYDPTGPAASDMCVRILDHARAMVQLQEATGHMYNLEATPCGGHDLTRFAKEDRKRFAGIIQAGTPDQPYHTNSSQPPVAYTGRPFQALEDQEVLQGKYTGGTVPHLYMGERLSSGAGLQGRWCAACHRLQGPLHHDHADLPICPVHGYLR